MPPAGSTFIAESAVSSGNPSRGTKPKTSRRIRSRHRTTRGATLSPPWIGVSRLESAQNIPRTSNTQ